MEPKTTMRRAPQQQRSQARVEAILAATRRLVGTRGNDAVSMREIAADAGVPVSSVYQYFPDKNALLEALLRRYLERMQAVMLRVLAPVRSMEQFIDAVPSLLDGLYALFEEEPELAPIWSCVKANAVLRDIDMEDTRQTAALLQALAVRFLPAADPEALADVALHVSHVAFFALRVAYQSPPDERVRLLREQKKVIAMRMRSIANAPP